MFSYAKLLLLFLTGIMGSPLIVSSSGELVEELRLGAGRMASLTQTTWQSAATLVSRWLSLINECVLSLTEKYVRTKSSDLPTSWLAAPESSAS